MDRKHSRGRHCTSGFVPVVAAPAHVIPLDDGDGVMAEDAAAAADSAAEDGEGAIDEIKGLEVQILMVSKA